MSRPRRPSAEELAPYRGKRDPERYRRIGERAATVRLRRTEEKNTIVEPRPQPPESGEGSES